MSLRRTPPPNKSEMAKPSNIPATSPTPSWVKPTGTASSSRTIGEPPAPAGDPPVPTSKPKDEEKPSGPGGDPPGSPGDPGSPGGPGGPGGGGGRNPRPPSPRQPLPPPFRPNNDHKSIPKLNHKLTGAENFAGWLRELTLCLFMYDITEEHTYWEVIDGPLSTESEAVRFGVRTKDWMRATGFILLVIRKNCEDGPFRLIRLSNTAAEALRILKTQYENKMVADLGIALTDITTMAYKDDSQGGIEAHIEAFENKWEKMSTIASGTLRPAYEDFRIILQHLSNNEIAKKELLLATLPKGVMKYSQLIQNLRKGENTYGDIVSQLKQYVPQLAWKKRDDRHREIGTGSKDSPITINRNAQQLTDRFGKPLDMNKQCGYCQNVKKWRGIGHTEQECKTKQRDKEKNQGQGNAPSAKPAKLDLDDFGDEGVRVQRLFVRMIKATGSLNRPGWYEYDTGAQVHTANEQNRLLNKKPYTGVGI